MPKPILQKDNSEITVPREWFETLQKYTEAVGKSKDYKQEDYKLTMLLGYLASVDTILKIK